MLLAELKIKVHGENGELDVLLSNRYYRNKIDSAMEKLESYALQLFDEDWAKQLKLEIEE